MDNPPAPPNAPAAARKTIAVKTFGVGNAGVNVLEQITKRPLPGVSFVAVNSDAASLAASSVPAKIFVEPKSARGRGTGGGAGRGGAAVEECLPQFQEACAGADAVFIVAGLGGGAGTTLSPVLARAARAAGALVLAFVTLPFDCEGNHRQHRAQQGVEQLGAEADGVLCLPHQKVLKLIHEHTGLAETFGIADALLADGVAGLWRLLAHKGLIEIHFADLCALLRDRRGESSFATAEAAGATRSREVMDQLFAHPMLDGGAVLAESEAVLVSLAGGPDLTMAEVNRVMEQVNSKCPGAQIIMGAAIDESFRERLAVTLVAARGGETRRAGPAGDETAGEDAGLRAQLLDGAATERPHSRFVPPSPALTPEKVEQLMARQAGRASRQRKTSLKMRQGQLPLEIVSKGRFDKSEPTIHKGEDLDVPTYIRRGVALN